MSEFTNKKARRNVKQSKTFISENVDRVQSKVEERSQIPSTEKHDAAIFLAAGLYTDLPSSLTIRKDATKGKGLWSNAAIRKGESE